MTTATIVSADAGNNAATKAALETLNVAGNLIISWKQGNTVYFAKNV